MSHYCSRLKVLVYGQLSNIVAEGLADDIRTEEQWSEAMRLLDARALTSCLSSFATALTRFRTSDVFPLTFFAAGGAILLASLLPPTLFSRSHSDQQLTIQFEKVLFILRRLFAYRLCSDLLWRLTGTVPSTLLSATSEVVFVR